MPLSEFQQPQQYVEDSIFYDFHKSFLPGIIMVGDRIKKKKKHKHQLVIGKKLTLGHVTGE